MYVKDLCKYDFCKIDPYKSVRSVEDQLVRDGFLVVVGDEGFAGILTSRDVVEYSHKLVADCLREKPKISADYDIEPVLVQMKDGHFSVLPVFERTTFIGVITLEDITDYYLFRYRKKLEHKVEQRTSELKLTIKILQQEISEHKQTWQKLCKTRDELAKRIDILEKFLPLCSFCKKLQNEEKEWIPIELYVKEHFKAEFSHSFCPECGKKHYGDFLE